MRMSQSLPETAWDLLHRSDETELARLFKIYGEEPYASAVAKTLKAAIERGQLLNDTFAVAQCIRASMPVGRGRIDPATRCFQALRMAVNHELDNVKKVLAVLPDLLPPGGRAVILSFHSLEDRLVKQAFVQAAKGCICPPQIPQCVCGKKPWAKLRMRKAIQASPAEQLANPRSRSVRMRSLEKL
jgi:16S rRNA (cytosine1402-N4)-methyltransferase